MFAASPHQGRTLKAGSFHTLETQYTLSFVVSIVVKSEK